MLLLLYLTLLFSLVIQCSAYRKTRPSDDRMARGGLSITEEDISLEHQVIQWEEKLTDVWSDYYAIPWELLNPQDLSDIGLKEFTKLGSYTDLKSLGPAFNTNLPISKDGLFVPKNTSLLFLFNTSTVYNFPAKGTTGGSGSGKAGVADRIRDAETADSIEAVQVIQTSLPLGLPEFHYVADYTLLVPKELLNRGMKLVPFQTASRWVRQIGLRRVAIPLSRDMMEENGLVLAFVIRSAKSLEDFVDDEETFQTLTRQTEDHNSKLSGDDDREEGYQKAKAYIEESLLLSQSEVAKAVISSSTGFFDNFARRWVASMGYESLLYSTFCQVNCRYREQSYCLKFKEGQHAIVSLLTIPHDHLDYSGVQKRSLTGDDGKQVVDEGNDEDRLRDISDYKLYSALTRVREFMSDVKDQATGYGPLSNHFYLFGVSKDLC